MGKTFAKTLSDMKANMNTLRPDIDTTEGTVVSDLFEPIADECENVYVDIEHIAVLNSFLYWDKMSNEELDDLSYNYGIVRKPATVSSGTVYFRTSRIPTMDVVIPAGTIATTEPDALYQTVSFISTAEQIMYLATITTYYNAVTGYYEIAVPVQCLVTGITGNIGVGTLKIIESSIPNIQNCYNYTAFTNAVDEETNEDLANRCLLVLKGVSVGTEAAYIANVMANAYVSDALLVGPGDALMVRDSGLGGKVDIYTKVDKDSTNVYTQTTMTFTYASETEKILSSQPVKNVVSVVGSISGALVENVNWKFTQDTGNFKGSIYAVDMIEFLILPVVGETITITYNYFSIIPTLQTDIEVVRPITADVLVKLADSIGIDVTALVYKDSTITDLVALANTIKTEVETFLTAKKLGVDIQQSDIIQVIHDVAGVDNIMIPLGKLCRTGLSGTTDVAINENEYGVYGTISISVV